MGKFKLTALNTLVKKVQALDINQILFQILQDVRVQEYILELNKSQLRDGVDSFGTKLSSYRPYSEAYRKIKGSSVVDLYVTGTFYDTFQLDNRVGGFDITANTAIYGQDFKNVYGDAIIGLSQPSLEALEEYLKPLIVKQIRDAIR